LKARIAAIWPSEWSWDMANLNICHCQTIT
jgi:hypothetical protein